MTDLLPQIICDPNLNANNGSNMKLPNDRMMRQDDTVHDEIVMEYAWHLVARHGLNTNVPDEYGYKLPVHVLSAQAFYNEKSWSDVALLLRELPPRMAELALMRSDGGNQWIPLHFAAVNAPRYIIILMLSLAPDAARVKTPNGCLPLHNAAYRKNVDILELLVNAYPEGVLEKDRYDRTPLHNAARMAPSSIINLMLSTAPYAARMKDCNGCLPLHFASSAVRLQKIEDIELLVNAYPEAILKKNNDGKTPLHYIAENGYIKFSRLDFVNLFVGACPKAIFATANDGKSPVHFLSLDDIVQVLPLVEWSYQALER